MKVLVIHDSQELVNSISFLIQLRWPHYSVISAADGSQVVELVETEVPDLVILDVAAGLDLIASSPLPGHPPGRRHRRCDAGLS